MEPRVSIDRTKHSPYPHGPPAGSERVSFSYPFLSTKRRKSKLSLHSSYDEIPKRAGTMICTVNVEYAPSYFRQLSLLRSQEGNMKRRNLP